MKFETQPVINCHFLAFKTDWLEHVGDDGYTMLHLSIDNGDFNRDNSNGATVRVLDANAPAEALVHGGLVVFSNVKKAAIRTAVLVGLQYMMRAGQLSPEDLCEHEQTEDPAQPEGDTRSDPAAD